MRAWLVYLLVAVALAALRAALIPGVGLYADLVVLVPVWWLWSAGYARASIIVALLVPLVCDLASPQRIPLLTATTFLAGSVYLAFIGSTLARDTGLTRIAGAALWLLVWRLARFAFLITGWLVGVVPVVPSLGAWYGLPLWLMFGTAACAGAVLLGRWLATRTWLKQLRSQTHAT